MRSASRPCSSALLSSLRASRASRRRPPTPLRQSEVAPAPRQSRNGSPSRPAHRAGPEGTAPGRVSAYPPPLVVSLEVARQLGQGLASFHRVGRGAQVGPTRPGFEGARDPPAGLAQAMSQTVRRSRIACISAAPAYFSSTAACRATIVSPRLPAAPRRAWACWTTSSRFPAMRADSAASRIASLWRARASSKARYVARLPLNRGNAPSTSIPSIAGKRSPAGPWTGSSGGTPLEGGGGGCKEGWPLEGGGGWCNRGGLEIQRRRVSNSASGSMGFET